MLAAVTVLLLTILPLLLLLPASMTFPVLLLGCNVMGAAAKAVACMQKECGWSSAAAGCAVIANSNASVTDPCLGQHLWRMRCVSHGCCYQ